MIRKDNHRGSSGKGSMIWKCLLSELKNKKLVCYVQGGAYYRKAPMNFSASYIDPFACTHIIYAYASLDPRTYTVHPQMEEFDVVQGECCEIMHINCKTGRK